jgi:hypothetical protein
VLENKGLYRIFAIDKEKVKGDDKLEKCGADKFYFPPST